MDFIDVGRRDLKTSGGSKTLTIPPIILRNLKNPIGFKIELSDRKVTLLPIYGVITLLSIANLFNAILILMMV